MERVEAELGAEPRLAVAPHARKEEALAVLRQPERRAGGWGGRGRGATAECCCGRQWRELSTRQLTT